jgi:hypothetical protein
MAKSKFEESKETGKHNWLSKLAGRWEGTTKVWFEPDKLADESETKGTIKEILGGRFIMHEYTGSMQGKPLEGIQIYGYDMTGERFQMVMLDTFHTGTLVLNQNGAEGDEKFSPLGSYDYKDPSGEITTWGWRTDIELVDDDNMIISMYNVFPNGESAKGVETVYKRSK